MLSEYLNKHYNTFVASIRLTREHLVLLIL